MGVDEYSTWTGRSEYCRPRHDGGQPLLEAVGKVWINLQKVPAQWLAFIECYTNSQTHMGLTEIPLIEFDDSSSDLLFQTG